MATPPDTAAGTTRRPLAILFTDAVGYDRLAKRDEAAARALLETHRRTVRSIAPEYDALDVHGHGDGLRALFPSPLSAVRCAIEIQRVLNARGAARAMAKRVRARIGIHQGDVEMRDGSDPLGEDVPIAERIAQLADPGGVCVSRLVAETIGSRMAEPLMPVRAPELGDVAVFRVVLPWTSHWRSMPARLWRAWKRPRLR